MHRFVILLGLAIATVSGLLAQGGPPGAAVSDIVAASGDTMFAATSRGVFSSASAGEIWAEINDGLPDLNIRSIAGNQDTLYAAVREHGVYRFRGDGPWEAVVNGLANLDILSVAANPQNVQVAYAGTANGQIFRTLDGGDTWGPLSQGLGDGAYLEIAVSPNDPNLILATNLSGDGATGRVYRTTNGGGNWENRATVQGVLFGGIAYAVSEHGTAWVASSAGLIVTRNSGTSFDGFVLPNTSVQDVEIDPEDAQVLYAGLLGAGVIKSTDGGQNWALSLTGLPRATVTRVMVAGETLYAGLDGSAVYRSHDKAATWQISSAGIHAADVQAVAARPGGSADVLASTTGGGLFRSANGGDAWGESREGLQSFRVSSLRYDPQSPDTVYAGTINPFNDSDGSFLRSSDGGRSWESLFTGLPVHAIATHPTDGNTVYFGTNTDQFGTTGLVRSRDGGETFDDVYGANGELAFLDVTGIEVDPVNPQNIYLLTRSPFTFPVYYQFAYSNNGGNDWFGTGLTESILYDVAVDPTDPSRVFVGSSTGLFRSTNSGQSFEALTSGLPGETELAAYSIVIDGNDNGAVYAVTSDGLLKSVDAGGTWAYADTGLDPALIWDVATAPDAGGVFYAATTGGGVFKTTNGGASWEPTGGVPALSSGGVVNAATFQGGGVAPGEIISIFVGNAGPAQGVVATEFDPATGLLPTTLAGVRVFFNDVPAPLFFVRSDQLNVQVPFEAAGLDSVEIRIEYEGAQSGSVRVPVRATDPGLFAPVLNQDYTLNSELNPAVRGSYVTLFATGQGAVTPPVQTGQPAPGAEPFARAAEDVRVLVNGVEVEPYFAGLTPGLVGLLQLNIQASVGGRVEIQVFIGGVESPSKAVVYVQ